MGLFGRRGHKPPDIVDLRLTNDVAGLQRALADDSADTVRAAADAIASIYLHEDEPARSRAATAGPALLTALAAMRSRADVPADLSTMLAAGDADVTVWHLIQALGAIRCAAAAPLLTALLADTTANSVQRTHAATALGEIGDPAALPTLAHIVADPRIDKPVVVSDATQELADAAAAALTRLGEPGVAALCERVSAQDSAAATAVAALRRVGAADPGAALARATLTRVDEAEQAARAAEQERRTAAEADQRRRRRETHPQAAELADRLGHPEWLADGGALRPDSFKDAVSACHSLGLAVDEHEEVVDNETSNVWALVTVAGESVLIDGGRRFRDVLY